MKPTKGPIPMMKFKFYDERDKLIPPDELIPLEEVTRQLLEQAARMIGSGEPSLQVAGKELLKKAAKQDATHTQKIIIDAPNTQRGEGTKNAASNGGNEKNRHYQEVRKKYQPFIDDLYSKNSKLSYADLCRRAGEEFRIHKDTIKRHTVNPRKK